MSRAPAPRVFPIAFSAALLLGCATPGGLLPQLERLQAQGQFEQAAALVDKSKETSYGAKNALLFHLDRAMLLHLAGKYAESNASFEEAKRLHRDLFTKSVRTEAGTLLTSDNLRPYAGEDFERAQVNVFAALNYAALGQGMEALVEARQVDDYLKKLRVDLGHKNVYTEDAFARYLMGMMYEEQGEVNDAHISYFKALEAYDRYAKEYGLAAPPQVVSDALRTAVALGFDERVRDIQKRWGGEVPAPRPKGAGEVVVIHHQGPSPRKVDTFFEISVVNGWAFVDAQRPVGEDAKQVEQARAIMRSVVADKMIRIAFPSFEPARYEVKQSAVKVAGVEAELPAVVVQDLGAIAVKNLKDRVLRERAKAIARAVVKWTLTQKIASKVEEKKGEGAAWLVKSLLQVASAVTELSDKRSWGTLPDKIAVARVTLPAGTHKVTALLRTAAGAAAGEKTFDAVEVRPGRRTFLVVKTVQ